MTEPTSGATIYVDANILIYFIDAEGDFAERAADFFRRSHEAGARLVTSELTMAECLYKPHRDGDGARVALYETAFKSGFIALYPLSGDLAVRAAEVGGSLGLKLVDAIHYLSALEAGCDVFVTADRRFRSCEQMEVIGI